jgi:FtsP/CotA-like multicopper oxidase with cupredoxin domain
MSFLRTSIAVLGLTGALSSAAAPSARPSGAPRAAGTMHTYFIAADEVAWDYAPRGRALTGAATRSIDDADGVRRTTYLKAIYREYTDDTFTTLKPRSPAWDHLGMLGPLLRAEVGDTIRVVYRNNTNGFFSMHPHGLAYDKASEGALYNDGTPDADKRDDRIPPGASHVYLWTVRLGPDPGPTIRARFSGCTTRTSSSQPT